MRGRFISVQEYLSTAYHPDIDYVGGQIQERNAGLPHSGHLRLRCGARRGSVYKTASSLY